MSLKFWLNKPVAFAKVWKERGLFSAISDSFQYILWFNQYRKARLKHQQWLLKSTPSPEIISQIRAEIEQWQQPTVFSVLVPVYNTKPFLLERAIESVRSQIYPHWQLILVDDFSPSDAPRQVLRNYADSDDRIQVIFAPKNGGISAATNIALEAATGEYIALLDHDDELTIDALYENARVIRQNPAVDVLYSDEDKMTERGDRFGFFFKPDWSPDLFHSCMYTCHLGVYRTSLVRAVGGFRSEYDGAQDWDLMLRVVEKTPHIYHIAKILYHWRVTATSVTAGAEVKPWAYTAAQKALEAMTHRSPYPGYVEPLSEPGFFRVRRHLVEKPLVSIVIPSAGALMPNQTRSHLENCLESLTTRSTYSNIEIVVVDGYDIPPDILDQAKSYGIELVRCDEPFNFSRRINAGVRHSRGDVVVMLNDDIEITTPDWIEAMLELAQQEDVGAVGAKLVYPNGNIQHAGVIILEGGPGHAYYDEKPDSPGYFTASLVNRNYLCVTGACLMVRREAFDEVGGMDDIFPLCYNDVDFCLKLHKAGYRNVFTPFVELIHHESASRDSTVLPEELETFHARWQDYLKSLGGDPYYNANFDQQSPTFAIDVDGNLQSATKHRP